MAQSLLLKAIHTALESLSLSYDSLKLEHPADESHGDYSSNIAMVLFSQISSSKSDRVFESPQAFAQQIVDLLITDKTLTDIVSKIEVQGPGFINFWLEDTYLSTRVLASISDKHTMEIAQSLHSKKIIVEYTDPNPFKEFHIGHLFPNIVGESLANILEALGASVKRVNYQGDVGLHVAKAIWGMRVLMDEDNITIDDLQDRSLEDRITFMGRGYARGTQAYEDESASSEIAALNKKIYENDDDIARFYESGRRWSLDYFDTIYSRLGTSFDTYYFERDSGRRGLEVVNKHPEVFEKSDDAIIFKGEMHGLHTRVFVNSQGLPTYEAKDLGLAFMKYEDFSYDKSIIVTANEVDSYFRVVIKALSLIDPAIGEKTTHVSHGMLKLASGKMSSRTGTIISGVWLLDHVRENVVDAFELEDESVAEQIAQAAIKYAILKIELGKDVIFDIKKTIAIQGNSGPYLLYAYARAKSVVQKGQSDFGGSSSEPDSKTAADVTYSAREEKILARSLYRFSEVVSLAGENYAPNIIANYLYDVAQKFNAFYQNVPILNAKNNALIAQRLKLAEATAKRLHDGLRMLGIKTVESL